MKLVAVTFKLAILEECWRYNLIRVDLREDNGSLGKVVGRCKYFQFCGPLMVFIPAAFLHILFIFLVFLFPFFLNNPFKICKNVEPILSSQVIQNRHSLSQAPEPYWFFADPWFIQTSLSWTFAVYEEKSKREEMANYFFLLFMVGEITAFLQIIGIQPVAKRGQFIMQEGWNCQSSVLPQVRDSGVQGT